MSALTNFTTTTGKKIRATDTTTKEEGYVTLVASKINNYSTSTNAFPVFDNIDIVPGYAEQDMPTHCKITIPALPNGGKVKVWFDFDVLEAPDGTTSTGVVKAGATQVYSAVLGREFTLGAAIKNNGVVVINYQQPKQCPNPQYIGFGEFVVAPGGGVNNLTLTVTVGYNAGYTAGVDNWAGIFDSAIMVETIEEL
jgi:hypothetical protein